MMGMIFHFPYRTIAEISLTALVKNLYTVRSLCRREVIPVVKADAYGHGMVPVAKALIGRGGCLALAVATLEEAMELRRRVPHSVSIIVLSGFVPHQVEAYTRHHLTPMIFSLSHLKSLVGKSHLPDIHLKVDTGMHRLGIMPDQLDDAYQTLARLGIKLAGLATHFAESESSISDFIDRQISIFDEVYRDLLNRKLIRTDARIHVANSGAVLRNKLGPSVAVRPGIALYGISPNPRLQQSGDLIPILEWKTRVLSLKTISRNETVGYGRTYRAKKKETIALLPIGYADGYPRLLSNVGSVLVRGKRLPIRGRVSMDLTCVGCSAIPHLREGTAVTLIGKDGTDRITAWDLANWAKTIPYEIFCGLSPSRVARIYLD